MNKIQRDGHLITNYRREQKRDDYDGSAVKCHSSFFSQSSFGYTVVIPCPSPGKRDSVNERTETTRDATLNDLKPDSTSSCSHTHPPISYLDGTSAGEGFGGMVTISASCCGLFISLCHYNVRCDVVYLGAEGQGHLHTVHNCSIGSSMSWPRTARAEWNHLSHVRFVEREGKLQPYRALLPRASHLAATSVRRLAPHPPPMNIQDPADHPPSTLSRSSSEVTRSHVFPCSRSSITSASGSPLTPFPSLRLPITSSFSFAKSP